MTKFDKVVHREVCSVVTRGEYMSLYAIDHLPLVCTCPYAIDYLP